MTDTKRDTNAHPNDGQGRHAGKQAGRVPGDPGVGGLLADPEEAATKPKPSAKTDPGPPTPDPELPNAHGDWAPNRAWRGQAEGKPKRGDKDTRK
jgi:hypothetical protein